MLPRMKMQAQITRRSLLDVRRSAARGKAFDSTDSTSMVSAVGLIPVAVVLVATLAVANRISEKQQHQKVRRDQESSSSAWICSKYTKLLSSIKSHTNNRDYSR